MKRGLCLPGIAILLLCIPGAASPTVLDVPTVIQEQDQWCWAAVSASVIRAAGTTVQQCTIAEYTRTHATWHDFGSVDCCDDPTQGCNYWNYNWGTAGSIQDILQAWGISNSGYSAALSLDAVENEIDAVRPFVIRWGWTGGGGHFLVGYGVESSTVYYMDPWPGEGAKIADYSWVVSGGSHTWTHTNLLTSPLPVQLVSFRAIWTGSNAVMLQWTTLSETNSFGFEVERRDSSAGHYHTLPGGFVPGQGTSLVPRHYTYLDQSPIAGGASYRLKQIDLDGSAHYSEAVIAEMLVGADDGAIPSRHALHFNYPNPFNPSTTIEFALPHPGHVTLKVYNVLGEEVAILSAGDHAAGTFTATWNASGMPSGVYLYRLSAGEYVQTMKMVLMR